ncbi:hypothetical protein [Polyangium fumosum]|uniref:Uncharacterized protein n=1 Tax=Polyangium fumosum TaxID=889272 RepID=A0A4U1INU0_9BACT|nr:hypothetical protein [Polyangium fumosum]TKC95764.1 hypothetical protein E8A74_46775 [Polyangium fumosum]
MGFDDLKRNYQAAADAAHAAAEKQEAQVKTKKEADEAERKAWPAALEAAMPVINAVAEEAAKTIKGFHIAPRQVPTLERNAPFQHGRPNDKHHYNEAHGAS